MNKLFSKIGQWIEKSPFKVLLLSLLAFVILITGAIKMNMATGNETLVKTDSDAYISNHNMEEDFGGDAMMVLLHGDKEDLLSQKNIEKMWNIEQRLQYNEGIYSFLSPASIVHQITDKQGDEIKKKIPDISDGLGEMSEKLIEIGNELANKDVPDPAEIEKKLDDLMGSMDPDSLMKDMLKEQEKEMAKMTEDVSTMSGGLSQMGDKLIGIGTELASKELPNPEEIEQKLDSLMNTMNPDKLIEEMLGEQEAEIAAMMAQMEKEIDGMKSSLSGGISPDELKSMSGGLTTMGEKLKEISGGLSNLPDKMGEALSGAQDPSSIFADMTSKIENEVQEMKSNLSGGMDPEELKTMADGFVTMGENLEDLSEGLGTFYEKSGMMIANIPHNQEELDNILYEEDGELRDVFSNTIIDDEHLMMMIKLQGNLEDSDKDAIYEELAYAIEGENFKEGDVDYVLSGKPVLDSSLREEMMKNMQYMVVMAAIIMLIVLFFVFKVRWKLLSIGIILISVIATLGLMGHLSVSMTMVSMAVFPILIGLGIDYSIQFHNRYEEELSVTNSLSQIGKAVAVAVFATMLGFISLYASPVPMIQDFGKMLTIGVVVSFLGSIFLLMPILHIRDVFNSKAPLGRNRNIEDASIMGTILGAIAKFVTKFAPLVLIVAIVLAGWGLYSDAKVGVETDIETFMPQDMDALKDIRYVRDVVGSTDQMVIYMKDDDIVSKSNISWIQNKVKYIEDKFHSQVEDVMSIDDLVKNLSEDEELSYQEYIDVIDDIPENQRSMFVNEDRNKGVVIINIKHMSTEKLQEFVKDIKNSLEDAPMDVSVTGKSVLDVEMVKGLTDGRVKMTLLGLALVFIALLFVYKSLFKALVPVLPIILIVGMSGGIMYLLGFKYTPITATLGALILGIGTEMTIMFLERYMEERNNGKNKADAMDITVNRIGKATLASGLTTIGGFSVLMFSKFVILKDFGLMTVINVSLALMSTFVILPAVIWNFDRFIIKEKKKKQ